MSNVTDTHKQTNYFPEIDHNIAWLFQSRKEVLHGVFVSKAKEIQYKTCC